MDEYKYFAFISYSHKDKKEAQKLFRRLNYYRIPVGLANDIKKKEGRILPEKLSPIFIDDEEMAQTSLEDAMISGLERSRFLIVVCSPNSAKSKYVNNEVQQFIDMGRGDRIIPYIIEGTPCSGDPGTECYPPNMRDEDRLGADVQSLKGDAVLRVIATMLGVDMGVLAQRERQRRERIILSVAATIIALVSIFALYNNRMRGLIAEENFKYRTSLSNQYLQNGASLQNEGNEQEALAYFAEALKADPSNPGAKMSALVSLQKQGWCTSVSESTPTDSVSQGQNTAVITDSNADKDDEQYGEYVRSGKFGHSSYDVYKSNEVITLRLNDTGRAYRAQIPVYLQEDIMDHPCVSLVGKDSEIRMVVMQKYAGLIYSFDSQKNNNAEPLTGELIDMIDGREVVLQYLTEKEKNNSNYGYSSDAYGSQTSGLALLVFDYPGIPILYDVFQNRGVQRLDLQGDALVLDVAFEDNGYEFAVLTKVHTETLLNYSNIHVYNTVGDYLFTAEMDYNERVSHSIEFSCDGKSLLYCSRDAINLFSSEDGKRICPPLNSNPSYLDACYSDENTIIARLANGSSIEYELRCFMPAMSYDYPEPDQHITNYDNYSININENMYITVRDPDIVLFDSAAGTEDRAAGILNMPEGLNDGYLWEPGFCIDREAKVCYCYGYQENVFYRVRYDEEDGKILDAEPIVLQGRQSFSVNAFDDMCVVRTVDDYLLGYHNDSNEPFFSMSAKSIGHICNMKWIENNIIAFELSKASEGTAYYSLQLWDVNKGIPITLLEKDQREEMTDFRYSDGILSYRKEQEPVFWILNAADPDSKAVDLLSELPCYELDETGIARLDVPLFTGDLGNWDDILVAE